MKITTQNILFFIPLILFFLLGFYIGLNDEEYSKPICLQYGFNDTIWEDYAWREWCEFGAFGEQGKLTITNKSLSCIGKKSNNTLFTHKCALMGKLKDVRNETNF